MKVFFVLLVFVSAMLFLASVLRFKKLKPLLKQIGMESHNTFETEPNLNDVILYIAREVGKFSVKLLPDRTVSRIRRKLDCAGYPLNMDVQEFEGMKIMMSGILAVMFALVSGSVLGGLLAGTVIGVIYLTFWLSERITQRKKAIARDIPFAIDLLTVAVEAGLGFDNAIAKVVQKGKKGPLRDVLSDMLSEVRLGKSRDEALRSMADRVGVEELSSFVSTLLMADRFGTSVGQILRVLSRQARLKRLQRAESIALKAPVKMVFPMVLFIFPTILIMLLAPVLLNNFLAS